MEFYDISLVTIPILIFLAYKFATRNFNYWKDRNIPFVKPVPLFGNAASVALFREALGIRVTSLYNEINEKFFGFFIFNQPYLLAKDPELIRHILVKDFDYFVDRTVFSDEQIDSLSANFLFISKGRKWKAVRTKMSPAFSSGKLKNMSGLMEAVAQSMKTHIKKGVAQDAVENVKEICSKYSMDVLASCAFGVDANCFTDENAEFYNIGKRIFGFSFLNNLRFLAYFISAPFIRFTRLTLLDSYVNKFIRNTLGYTIKERENAGYKRHDLVDHLIEFKRVNEANGVKIDGDVLAGQAGQFFAAGFETVSSTMAFTLYELATHPEVQKKLRLQIANTIKEHGKINYASVSKLPYLDQVVKETLRKYPVLPFLDRRCSRKYRIPGTDIDLEPGIPVYIPMYALHHDAKYFPNPEKYDPDRFSEENRNNIPNSVYIPFGDGPRICIGERFGLIAVKIGLAQILSEFEVERCEKTPVSLEFEKNGITLLPESPICVKFNLSLIVAA